MKQKFKIGSLLISVLLLLCITLSGCNKIYHWKIEKGIEEILYIKVGRNFGYSDEVEICEIDKTHYQEIINDIEALEAKKYGWNLEASSGDAVKIVFSDKTFDIISLYEPHHTFYREDGTADWQITWLHFDDDEFSEFIKKWTTPQSKK